MKKKKGLWMKSVLKEYYLDLHEACKKGQFQQAERILNWINNLKQIIILNEKF